MPGMPPSPESMMDTDKLPLVDVEFAPQGRSARALPPPRSWGGGTREMRVQVAAPQFKSEDRP